MNLIWTRHLSGKEEKESFEKRVKSASHVLKRLDQIAQEFQEALDKQESSLQDFDQPNWDYKQAFRNGSRATLRTLRNILDLERKN